MPDTANGEPLQETSESRPPVSSVSLKLPPFWANDPEIWFAQVEAQFQTRGVTAEATKFAYIVASLQPEIALEVRDILVEPPQAEPYKKLKAALVKRTSVSEQKRLNKLLTSEELGDRSPSQLLRKMQQLLGSHTLETSILRQLFLQRLPTNVQLILASTSDNVSLVELAALADKIVEVAGPPTIAHVLPKSVPTHTQAHAAPHDSGEVQRLSTQVAQLTAQVQALTCSLQTNHRSRSQQRGPMNSGRRQSASRSPHRHQQHAGAECWYHWRHGNRAQKCVSPCSYSAGQSRPRQTQGNGPAKE